LKEISRALLQADVQFKMAMNMQNNIKKIVNLDDLAAGHNKRKIIQQVRKFPPPSLPPHLCVTRP
jgi:signal recognition particle subunit SRP54